MENMNKGLTVPKWVLIVWPKIPQMPQNLFAQFTCPNPKDLDFNGKRLHWASIVRGCVGVPFLGWYTLHFCLSILLTYLYFNGGGRGRLCPHCICLLVPQILVFPTSLSNNNEMTIFWKYQIWAKFTIPNSIPSPYCSPNFYTNLCNSAKYIQAI